MFAAKILKKMASPGLTFGEHCANLEDFAGPAESTEMKCF
jgi:hypothetical protein